MSESKITEQDVRDVAEANLDLRENARTPMVRDLNSILGYIERLNELNTDNVQPMAQVSDRYGVDESKEEAHVLPMPAGKTCERVCGHRRTKKL